MKMFSAVPLKVEGVGVMYDISFNWIGVPVGLEEASVSEITGLPPVKAVTMCLALVASEFLLLEVEEPHALVLPLVHARKPK